MRSSANPLWDLLTKLLGAAAAGLGVLGFVTLVGGATAYVRFSSAGLPAEESVANLPRTALLVLGAKALIFYAALSLAAVAVLFLAERDVEPQSGPGRASTIDRLRWAARRGMAADPSSRAAQRDKQAIRSDQEKHRYKVRLISTLAGAGVGIVLHSVGTTFQTLYRPQPWWSLLVGVIFGIVLFIGVMAIAGASPFVAFALTAVIASGIFGAATAALRIAADPPVSPAAILRTDGAAIGGIFVSATSDHVILAEVCAAGPHSHVGANATGSSIEIPRTRVTRLVVGNNIDLSSAIRREGTLLRTLMGRSVDLPRETAKGAPCTGSAPKSLSDASSG